MKNSEKVGGEIDKLTEALIRRQDKDGAWRLCFESGPMTDAYLLIILRVLEYEEETLIRKLYRRLISTQQHNGAWKLYDDDEGNLSATVEAYTALLYSGYATRLDANMKKAQDFILEHGGLEKVHVSTKFMLALNDLYPWPKFFPLPLFLLNIPKVFPIHFNKFTSYVRTHLSPTLILGHKKFSIRNDGTPDISHLLRNAKKVSNRKKGFFSRLFPFRMVSSKAIKKAESHMIERIEDDGTLYSYATATFYMIYAMLSLGYRSKSPYILHAVEGLKSMLYDDLEGTHLQNSPSTVWDTALISYALQESGIPIENPAILSSAKFLATVQHKEGNVHKLRGWGFSATNTKHPDIDDTQAALRAISRFALHQSESRKSWNPGVRWLMEMQNNDGGWSAFERNQYQSFVGLFPIENFKDTAIDPSTADMTGRTLEFLGNYVKMTKSHPKIQLGVEWLRKHQEMNGSWYGRWGVSYIYGTWAAVTGMTAVGVEADHPSIQRGVHWLKSIQRSDGGWGESCKSDIERDFVPLSFSTIVQTSWALDALIASTDHSTETIERGIEFLIRGHDETGKSATYPTGAGLPGHFYIHYHSYPLIWPLLALSHYRYKFSQ